MGEFCGDAGLMTQAVVAGAEGEKEGRGRSKGDRVLKEQRLVGGGSASGRFMVSNLRRNLFTAKHKVGVSGTRGSQVQEKERLPDKNPRRDSKNSNQKRINLRGPR